MSQSPRPVSEKGLLQQHALQKEVALLLAPVHVVADRDLVLQTQRRVRARSLEMAARRKQLRQRAGLAILVLSLVCLLLTPVLWGWFNQSADAWRNFTESEYQVIYITGLLLPVTLFTLLVAFLRTDRQKSTRKLGWMVW